MLLALGITKPVKRTVIILQRIQFNCNLDFCQTSLCVLTKLKRAIFVSDTVFKNTTSTKKQQKNNPSPTIFRQTDRTLKPYSGLMFFFFKKGKRMGSERAPHCSIFDQKQSKNSFFKSD